MQAASPPPKTEYIAKSFKAKSLAFKAPISLSKSDTQRRYTIYYTVKTKHNTNVVVRKNTKGES